MLTPLLPLFLVLLQEPFEPPKTNVPDSFRGAVGLFRIKATAEPATVAAGEPIRYTLTITADDSVKVLVPPSRPELEKDEDFSRLFRVETPDPPGRLQGQTWEFSYLLKPKKEGALDIPEFIFGFFNPTFGQDPKGYQEPSTALIPITVTPAPVKEIKVEGAADADAYPASVRTLPDDDAILRRDQPWSLPAAGWLLMLLIAPPVAAVAWLLAWRRLYPDAARLARLRQSRAARQALHALARARANQAGRLAEEVAGIVSVYLDHRLGLHGAAPTPTEVDTFLRGAGVPDGLRERITALLETCDALRFSNIPPAVSGSLADAAREIILSLEEPWATPQS